jgi:hypothetical protein
MPNAIASGMATLDDTSPAMISSLRSLATPDEPILYGAGAPPREVRFKETIGSAINPVRPDRASALKAPWARCAQFAGTPGPRCGLESGAPFAVHIWTAQWSATMQPDLLLVWAAILGGLTFLAMAAD